MAPQSSNEGRLDYARPSRSRSSAMQALGLDPDLEDNLNQDKTKPTTIITDGQRDSPNGAASEETSPVIPTKRQAKAPALTQGRKKQKGNTTAKGGQYSNKRSSQLAVLVQDDQSELSPPASPQSGDGSFDASDGTPSNNDQADKTDTTMRPLTVDGEDEPATGDALLPPLDAPEAVSDKVAAKGGKKGIQDGEPGKFKRNCRNCARLKLSCDDPPRNAEKAAMNIQAVAIARKSDPNVNMVADFYKPADWHKWTSIIRDEIPRGKPSASQINKDLFSFKAATKQENKKLWDRIQHLEDANQHLASRLSIVEMRLEAMAAVQPPVAPYLSAPGQYTDQPSQMDHSLNPPYTYGLPPTHSGYTGIGQ
ncbi:hypothetical protein N0V84_007341 [Fusarium piperis]|uniref:Uncharacterized protein n=1 Tax=Fusarium piperis TaxID=1435070 RepID=A0A9W8WA44_9HYPO|nr:hypothetical protein N0V84_007341 [Fusarium piperis]